ncbi:MAG: flagellar hook-associated protein FlgK [Planctomycetota bacterium]
MGLSSSLQIGRSGLLSAQAALQVAGNNLANVNTRGYHRQTVALSPTPYRELGQGQFIGTGVQIDEIARQIDSALEARLRGAVSDSGRSNTRTELLTQLEAIDNELTDVDLSTRLAAFFTAWDDAASSPQDLAARTLVVEESKSLSTFIQGLRTDYGQLQLQTDRQLAASAETVDDLLSRIEGLNTSIVLAEGGIGTPRNGAGGLRDQRDVLISELSTYLDVSTVEQTNGEIDLFVGSTALMLGGESRGVVVLTETVDGKRTSSVRLREDNSPLSIRTGSLGALVEFRENDLQTAIDQLDALSGNLIFEVNRLHSVAQGLEPPGSFEGVYRVDDTAAALNSEDAGLFFSPENGSFEVRLIQQSTGQVQTTVIDVDLDGIDPTNDTSLDDLIAQLGAVANLTATATPDGRLSVQADAGYAIGFGSDTSGVLAALGVNAYFTGDDASDIGVADRLFDPRLVGLSSNGNPGDNRAALAIGALRDQNLDALQGLSLTAYWNRHVEDFGIRLAQSQEQSQADAVVQANLSEQQQAISGVNADEETIALIQHQRAFQASARFISVVDELIQTLLSLV